MDKCEFCGELLQKDPDDLPWRFMGGDQVLHWFCSYLCAIRFFKMIL